MSKQVVVFDMGKVIFDYDLSKFIKAYAKKIPGKIDDINKLIFEYSDLAASFEQGTINPKDFYDTLAQKTYDTLAQKTHYNFLYNEFSVIWNNVFEPIPGTIEIIALLARNGYKLGILSNTNILHYEYLHARYPNIFMLFSKIHLSYEMRMRKPDDDIYREVIRYTGFHPMRYFLPMIWP